MSYDRSKSFNRLKGIIKRTHNDLQDKIIVKKKDSYQAYGEFDIKEHGLYWHVTTNFFDDPKIFGTVKSALAWCIAYKTSRYELANLIKHLDNRLTAKQNDIDFLTQRLKHPMDDETMFIMKCRLSEDIYSRQTYKQQLSNCVNVTKYIQIKGIQNNELRRFTKAS